MMIALYFILFFILFFILGLFAGLYGTGEAISSLTNQRRNLVANTHWAHNTNYNNDYNNDYDKNDRNNKKGIYNTSNTEYSKIESYNEISENNKNGIYPKTKNDVMQNERSKEKSEFSRALIGTFTPTMMNPIVCISAGSSVIFDITNTQYPIYLKDSLLNTNPAFDYWEFRKLSALAVTSVNITSFAFTFISAGERERMQCNYGWIELMIKYFFSFHFFISFHSNDYLYVCTCVCVYVCMYVCGHIFVNFNSNL